MLLCDILFRSDPFGVPWGGGGEGYCPGGYWHGWLLARVVIGTGGYWHGWLLARVVNVRGLMS